MTLNILLILLAITGLLNTIVILYMQKRLKDLSDLSDRRDEALRTAAKALAGTQGDLAGDIAELKKETAELTAKMDSAEKKLDDLPLEEMEEEYRSLAAFNEGVQNIMGFGPNVPKLNKEGVKRGG
jgi:chromosome segregation ATPase